MATVTVTVAVAVVWEVPLATIDGDPSATVTFAAGPTDGPVSASWLLPLTVGLTLVSVAVIVTAGLTVVELVIVAV